MDRVAYNALLAQYATPEVSGDGRVSWDGGVRCVIPSVKLYGKCEQDGTPTPDAPVPIKCNNGVYRAADAAGEYDGGQAMAPELYAIPGTEYRDEWDTQTGQGVRRCGKYIFTGREDFEISKGYSTADYNAFFAFNAVPNVLNSLNHHGFCTHLVRKQNAFKNEIGVIFGLSNNQIYFSMPKDIYPDAASWKSFLAEQYAAGTPVTLVYALNTPETFTATPTRLTMPPGAGQIIQVGGDVADCPITARYLTHS